MILVALAPTALVRASHVIVAALLLLGFYAVGVNVSAERREDAAPLLERPDRRVVTAIGLRVAFTPVILAGTSALAIRLPHAYLLQAAMPAGINSLVVGHAYGLDQRLIATIIVWGTSRRC
jgi:predicted permease